MPPAPRPKVALGDPFLLPVCDCGGPVALASLEPHPTRRDREIKTYKCANCCKQQVFTVRTRPEVVRR